MSVVMAKQSAIESERLYPLREIVELGLIPSPMHGHKSVCQDTLLRMIQQGDLKSTPRKRGARRYHFILGAELLRYLRENGMERRR